MSKHIKGLIGILVLSAAILSGCRSGSSASTGACDNPSTCSLTSVAYGAGVFVAVGSGGELRADQGGEPWIETSTDGINWTPEDIQYTPAQLDQAYILQSIVYGEDGFVTTDGVHVLHSTDGRNWDIESFQDPSDKISYVIYDGTRYILYSNTTGPYGNIYGIVDNFPWKVSTDGVNWTDYGNITVTNVGSLGEPVSIIHVGGMYEAAWQSGQSRPQYLTATSPDGLSWTLDIPVPPTGPLGLPNVYSILHTGGQFLVFGGVDETPTGRGSWGVALYGSSISAMTAEALTADKGQFYPEGEFYPAGAPLHGNFYAITGLVSNGTVTLGLGSPGLFETTDGVNWNFESMEGIVPDSPNCLFEEGASCVTTAAGAAAPGGSIVVLMHDGAIGAESMDGIHWVKSNL